MYYLTINTLSEQTFSPCSDDRAGIWVTSRLPPALHLSASYRSFTLSAECSVTSASPWDSLVPRQHGYSQTPQLQTIHTRAKPYSGLRTRTFFLHRQLGLALTPHNNVFWSLLLRFIKEIQNASSKFLLNWRRQLSSLTRINCSIIRFRMPDQVINKKIPPKPAFSSSMKKTHSLDQHNNFQNKSAEGDRTISLAPREQGTQGNCQNSIDSFHTIKIGFTEWN